MNLGQPQPPNRVDLIQYLLNGAGFGQTPAALGGGLGNSNRPLPANQPSQFNNRRLLDLMAIAPHRVPGTQLSNHPQYQELRMLRGISDR